ncbi:MAG: Ig-like domain-containing protein, partial [Deltaproteobacteria bacterium]|nr:Ig-like domain-containing protein [Deltaproteobacteria bacterium]
GNTFSGNGNYDIYFSNPAGGVITGNTINNGLYLSTMGVGQMSGNTFNCNAAYPLSLVADDVGKLMANTFNNTSGSYLKVSGGTVSKDATWLAILPYHILSTVTVQGADGPDGITTLTFQPGAELRFNQSTSLTVGASSGSPGALVSQGTLPSPVVFTSNQATPLSGNWVGISFQNTASDTASLVQLCTIEYATNGIYCNNAKPAIQGNIIRQASNAGLYFTGSGSNDAVVECNTLSDNRYGIYISNALPLAHHNDLLGNTLYDMYNVGTQVNAENNWWGSATDPGNTTNTVYGPIDYTPWSTALNDCRSNYGSNDTTPPELVSTSPGDGAIMQSIATITFTMHDQESGINDQAVIESVVAQQEGAGNVSGITVENNDTFILTPAVLPLADGLYTVTLTASDAIGNTAPYSFSFTIDTQGPRKPVITGGLVASGAIRERPNQNIADNTAILLTGTAENQTTLWINGMQHQTITSGSWSSSLTLANGDNTFEVWVEDGVGNRSPSAWVDIWLETAPMMNLEYDEAGRLQHADIHN